jgi:hypothetical protein
MGIDLHFRRFDGRKRQYALSPFHDHIIRDKDDLRNHLAYIARQCERHGCVGCGWVESPRINSNDISYVQQMDVAGNQCIAMYFHRGGDPEIVFRDGGSFCFKFKSNFCILLGRFSANRNYGTLIEEVSE